MNFIFLIWVTHGNNIIKQFGGISIFNVKQLFEELLGLLVSKVPLAFIITHVEQLLYLPVVLVLYELSLFYNTSLVMVVNYG